MSVGSQWVVLPRFSCLFYKAVRSNEGLHTNTHSNTQTPSNCAGNRPDPCPPSVCTYVHVTEQASVQWRRQGGEQPLKCISKNGQTWTASGSGGRIIFHLKIRYVHLHLCTACLCQAVRRETLFKGQGYDWCYEAIKSRPSILTLSASYFLLPDFVFGCCEEFYHPCLWETVRKSLRNVFPYLYL